MLFIRSVEKTQKKSAAHMLNVNVELITLRNIFLCNVTHCDNFHVSNFFFSACPPPVVSVNFGLLLFTFIRVALLCCLFATNAHRMRIHCKRESKHVIHIVVGGLVSYHLVNREVLFGCHDIQRQRLNPIENAITSILSSCGILM